MKIRVLALAAGSFFVFGPLVAFAHHAFSSEFDKNKPVTLNGTVSKVDWAKPHAYIYLDAKNESGKTEQWKLETANPDFLTKQGLKQTSLKKGTKLTVNGYAATKNAHLASARMVTMADGKSLQVGNPAEDGGPAK
jgi:hypothetical protein